MIFSRWRELSCEEKVEVVICVLILAAVVLIQGCATSPSLRDAQRACDQSRLGLYEYHNRSVDITVECDERNESSRSGH